MSPESILVEKGERTRTWERIPSRACRGEPCEVAGGIEVESWLEALHSKAAIRSPLEHLVERRADAHRVAKQTRYGVMKSHQIVAPVRVGTDHEIRSRETIHGLAKR